MTLVLVIGVVLLIFIVLALVWPVRLSVSGQAHGEPDGSWAAAAGAQLGPFTVAVVTARGIPAILTLHLLGRELMRKILGASQQPEPQSSEPDATAKPESEEPASRTPKSGFRLWRRFKQRVDWIDLAGQVLTERRRFEIGTLDIDLAYSFRDVALTGKVVGGIYALAAVLPRRVRVHQTPRWEFVDRFQIGANGYLQLRPGLLLCDAVWYVLKVSVRSPAVAQGAPHSP